jgi:ribosomal protein L31E
MREMKSEIQSHETIQIEQSETNRNIREIRIGRKERREEMYEKSESSVEIRNELSERIWKRAGIEILSNSDLVNS